MRGGQMVRGCRYGDRPDRVDIGQTAAGDPAAPGTVGVGGIVSEGHREPDRHASGERREFDAAEPHAPVAGEPIRVLVVDDHALFRRGLEMVLTQEPDIDLVGEASDGAEAVAKAGQMLPDIVLMDVRMPKRSGIEACTAIKDVVPSAKIIMLTISDEEADLYDAIKAGAMGYLLKEISIDEVAAAIRAVHGGQSLISPSMASKLLSEFASMIKKGDSRQQVPAPKLTDREMEVLRLVAKGLNNRDIAKQLFISENTVKNHVRNILEKLQLHSRMEAVVYAVREKLLEIT